MPSLDVRDSSILVALAKRHLRDHEHAFGLIRFQDDFPCPAAVTCGHHPPAFLDVRPEARRVFEHLSTVRLRELPIGQALLGSGAGVMGNHDSYSD